MREILFRGKPKNEVEYKVLRELCEDDCKNGFVYGSLIVNRNKCYICTMIIQFRSGIGSYIPTMIEVIPETVGEYTTLTDKNGTKIFEGDIVLLKGDEEPYQVAFDESCFQVYGNSICYVMDNFYDHDIEVIGNIYDNPELLEGDGSA